MAYVKTILSASTAKTLTINYSADEDDFMFLFDARQYGSVPTPSGWTSLSYNHNSSGGGGSEIFYRRATASEPTSVTTVHSSSNNRHSLQLIICTGVDATTAFDVTVTSRSSASANVIAVPSITPVTANCLLLHFIVPQGKQAAAEAGPLKLQKLTEGFGTSSSYYSYSKAASAATDTFNLNFGEVTSRNSVAVTIALRDDGTDKRKGFIDVGSPPADILHLLYTEGRSGALTGTARVDVTATITDYQGYTPVYNSIAAGDFNFEDGFLGHGIATSSSGTTSNILQSATVTASVNALAGEIISMSSQGDPEMYDAFDDRAKGFSIGDGTNFRTWRIDAKDTKPTGSQGAFSIAIEVEGGFESQADVGTVTPTTLDNTDYFVLQNYGIPTYKNNNYGFLYKLNTMIILGGSTTFPSSMEVGAECGRTSSLRTVSSQNQQSQTQYFIGHQVQVGDGSRPTIWDSNLHAMEWPSASSDAERRVQFQVSAGKFGIEYHGTTTCNFDIRSTFNMGNFHTWAINASSSTSTTWTENGAVIIGGDVTLQDIGRDIAGMTFTGCKELAYNSADLGGGNTISSCVDAQAVTVTSQPDLHLFDNCTFSDNTGNAILITGNQSGAWTDPNITMSGHTKDIKYTGTSNFTIASDLPITVDNASSGVLSIITPTFDLTVDSSESASQIHVYTNGTQIILDSEASAAQLVFTHSGETVAITVLKDGFIPFRQTGIVLSGNVTIAADLVASREYDSSHGLLYTTDASWASNQLTVPTYGVTGQGVFSLILEAFKSETALRNTAFNLQMDGAGSLYLVDDAEGASDASITNLIECGCEYLDTAGLKTASWVGIKSVGTATGFQGEFQQEDGLNTTNARATGIFNELIKMYGDASHGNFDFTDHLVLKYQPNTYREARSDVLSDYGISALAPTLYIVALQPQAIGITAGDPAISVTIVDHTSVPLVVGGKSFDYEIQDNGANDGNAMLREINFNLSQNTNYPSSGPTQDPFNWPEMLLLSGSSYETIAGIVEGGAGTHGVYVSRGGLDHPDFTRHQSNDNSYYVKPITANASISSIVSGSRLRIYNESTATETYNDVPGTSFSDSYTEGSTYTAGNIISIYITQTSGVTAQLPYTATAIASSTGWTVIAAQVSDTVYDGYGLNGSSITKFSADYVNDEVDLTVASNFSAQEFYAWWSYNLTTSQGISDFYGGVTALDAANLRLNNSIVNLFWDNTTATNVYQTDNIRIYRADEAYPVQNPTSGGGGIDVVWRSKVFIAETGVSGLTGPESTQLFAASTYDPAVDTVEGSETYQESMRLMRAEAAGKLAVSGTTVTFRDAADTKDRITATVDANGQRTAITTDAS
jgi:hypothetical protein